MTSLREPLVNERPAALRGEAERERLGPYRVAPRQHRPTTAAPPTARDREHDDPMASDDRRRTPPNHRDTRDESDVLMREPMPWRSAGEVTF